MSLLGLLLLLLIAAICGSVGQSLAGYDLGGCLVSIVVGFIGAYLGMWLAGKFGLPEIFQVSIEGKPFPIIWAVIGSALFTLVVALIRRAAGGGRRY
ncbi:MAG: GlsB/YeaQ/YmgE family stress response membrane protein [Chitinophagaceae bacterium]|nr:MAG: GlsB/YeaQ/YmgE family stress response membrane protein [Chitinophagaceae bacterium]